MADLTPNDLSHLRDDEFNALCPHDGHAPGPEPLSPAAQAVLDAAEARWLDVDDDIPAQVVIAALRAVADQVVPADPDMPEKWEEKDEIRAELLAIATELENQ